jgi:hypothetical protein
LRARRARALFVVGVVAFDLAAAARGRFGAAPVLAAVARGGASPAGEGVERGPSATSALRSRSAFAGELAKALLDLFMQAVDHLA